MKLYANLFSCLTLLYHSLISTRWSPESQPFRSLQEPDIVELPLHRLVFGPAAQHSSTWRTDTNQQFTFLQFQIPLYWMNYEIVPQFHRKFPISQFQIFIQHLWHSGRRLRGPKSRWSGWTLPERRSSSGSKRSERSSGNSMEIWMFLDLYNWDMVLRLLVLLSCQMLP